MQAVEQGEQCESAREVHQIRWFDASQPAEIVSFQLYRFTAANSPFGKRQREDKAAQAEKYKDAKAAGLCYLPEVAV
jgi:hypothetical protein